MKSQDYTDPRAAEDLAEELSMPRLYGEEAYQYYEAKNWRTDDGQLIRNRGAVLTAAIRRRWDLTCKKPNYHPTVDEVICAVRRLGFSEERGRSWHRQMTNKGWPVKWWRSSLEGAAKKWVEWGDTPKENSMLEDRTEGEQRRQRAIVHGVEALSTVDKYFTLSDAARTSVDGIVDRYYELEQIKAVQTD